MKNKLIKFHFIILLILVVNLFIIDGYNFGLNSYAKMTLLILLFGSGISMFALNVKPVLKLLVRLYSTFYIAVALLISYIIFTTDKHPTLVFPYDFYEPLRTHVPVYKQSDYEIYNYDKKGVLSFLNSCGGGIESGYYFLDKNYFIFKTRIGYFYSGHSVKVISEGNDVEFTKRDTYKHLKKKDIQNINVANDSVYINFNEGYNRVFEIEE
ncbi:hypothetical protein V9L05_05065 [Bernardetia sp. Wsw4-3y2]|uniref:hypothetical protein n=1 Tax=Bernardetia sp. Wsw4-3y2 TaxID=3127471 RepID=UPI0030CE23B3